MEKATVITEEYTKLTEYVRPLILLQILCLHSSLSPNALKAITS